MFALSDRINIQRFGKHAGVTGLQSGGMISAADLDG